MFTQIAHCEPPQEATIIIGIIDNGTLQLEKYPLNEFAGILTKEFRAQHTVCALDLENPDICFTCANCDQSTNNLIKISSVDIINDQSYVINWGALIGINIADYKINDITFIPWQHHQITSNHIKTETDTKTSVVKAMYTLNGIRQEEIIQFDCLIESICGIMTADAIKIEAHTLTAPLTFKEATNKGILVPEKNIGSSNKNFSIERDAEFDRIIEAMSNDGVIQFQKLTPVIVFLRRIGGFILVKYLMVKKYIYGLFDCKPQPHYRS